MISGFSGWNVIVTGGTRGIGLAITCSLLDGGANVCALYKCGNAAADALLSRYPESCLQVQQVDVSDYGQVELFFKNYNSTHKSLEILVNNAGIRKDNAVGMMPPDDWNSVISCNLTGTYNMSKFALLKMMENKFGRIVNISSPSGKFGFQGQANYSASKAGQLAFSKSLSKEAAKRGITVNCVSPGFIETELISDLSDEIRSSYKNMVPLKRFGKSEEVAAAVLFLCSRNASYITGTELEVTGGL